MKRTALIFLLAFAGASLILWATAPLGGAAPLAGQCGGQQWHAIAPIDCEKSRVIDGTEVHIHLIQEASGFEQVTFTLGTPRATDTLIHVTSHLGNSGAGDAFTDPAGIIPAGQLGPVTLTIPRALCGQNDIRAIFDNKAGRVAGPYIINDSCSSPPTTTTSPSSVPPTTAPHGPASSTETTTPGTTVASTVPGTNTVPPGAELAKTGSDPDRALVVAAATVVAGLGLVLVARRRPA